MSKLKELRLLLGLSQSQISRKLDMKVSTYASYEKLRRKPREYFLEKILNFAKENNFPLTQQDFKQ